MTYICWESSGGTSWKSIISSAYKCYLIVGYLFMIWDIGIIYIIKSKGPTTEPWGTPEVNRAGFDRKLPILKEKVIFLIKDIIHCKAILHKPISIRRCIWISWSIVSKAADKSRSKNWCVRCLLNLWSILSNTFRIAVSIIWWRV